MAITLRHQTVASTWSQIVEGGAGHEKEVMQTTYNFIEQARIPNVKMTQEEVRMGTAFGRRRDFIILTHERPLHEFIMWLGARDYGANLEGGWYVTGFHLRRDRQWSIAYSEELMFSMLATLQSTDRHHGIVGQECCHFQRDS
jgi:hypothetical protein